MTYNGCKNLETWTAWLWATSDESAYKLAKSAKNPDELALLIEATNPFDGVTDTPFGGLFFDLVETGLQKIDFFELFQVLNGDDDEEEDADDEDADDEKKTSHVAAPEAPCGAFAV